MASTNNAALFGDSDSSDESVKDEPMKDAEKPAKKDSDDDDQAVGEEGKTEQTTTPSNANLFGDDSSDDDEFDGNDGIVGKSADASKAGEGVKKPQTMSERLGLEDSDDENATDKQDEQQESQQSKPVDAPPRQMELLNLQETTDTSSQQPSLHIAKLPNLVGINTTPYNPSTHNLEEEEEYYRGYVHNMIRWRYAQKDGENSRDANGDLIRESNTRLVKWSDGTYTLHVGQEVLEVDTLDSSIPIDAEKAGSGALPGFAGINGYLYVSQKARIRPPKKETDPSDEKQDDDEEEPAQPAGTVLECLGPIASRFAPRPSSLASEAHRNLTNAIRQRNVKRARIAEIVTDFDPEKEKLARIKGKDDLAKSQQRGGRRSGGGGRRKMNASYLEEDGDYSGVNLGRLKRQTMRRDYSDEDEIDYGEDSDEEEDEWSKKKQRKRGAAVAAREKVQKKIGNFDESDSSEEGEVVFGDDDEEDGAMFKKRGGGAAKKSNILDDDDD